MGKAFLICLVTIVIADLSLLVTNRRLLVYEHLVQPGESYIVTDYGNLGQASQAQLACTYFNGRGFKTMVFWYSSSNMLGRDSCSFLFEI